MFFERLESPVMHYAWGEKASGDGAFIAELLGQEAGDQPWAELWLGAHPQASSVLAAGHCPLNKAIEAAPETMLGETLLEQGEHTLPFLLKILCCSSVLSIQSHPDKATAVRLHSTMPEAFPDDNHKPEVIYALSDFELMAGFRPLEDILADLSACRSLSAWRKSLPAEPTLKSVCEVLMSFEPKEIQAMAASLEAESTGHGGRFGLFRRLSAQYPGDCGIFFALLLNYMTLKPGEAVFVKANMPHAYVKGRGIECMANSNNVIRAGLTPKYVNRELLLETLDFKSITPDELKVDSPSDRFELVCGRDFRLNVHRLAAGEKAVFVGGRPAVLLIVEGRARLSAGTQVAEAPRGSSWFAPASIPDGAIEAADSAGALVAVASGV